MHIGKTQGANPPDHLSRSTEDESGLLRINQGGNSQDRETSGKKESKHALIIIKKAGPLPARLF
jgi:hypothetical protein